jgi:predicted ATPase
MFSHVSISNFKSIKCLEFEPRRVNVLIGERDDGKGLHGEINQRLSSLRDLIALLVVKQEDRILTLRKALVSHCSS